MVVNGSPIQVQHTGLKFRSPAKVLNPGCVGCFLVEFFHVFGLLDYSGQLVSNLLMAML